jgi:pyrroloquinoline quinone biosynthesis protein E
MVSPGSRPRLARKARLRFDAKTQRWMLLYPEKGLALNATGADILRLCTGELSLTEMAERLAVRYRRATDDVERDVLAFIDAMAARGLIEHDGTVAAASGPASRPAPASTESGPPRPYTLVAELTYRCPLRCVYCSNPLELARHRAEIDTATWQRVLREAESLGVVQVNLTGGEPLLRDDLESIVEAARAVDLYTNLITSGVPLARDRLARLRDAGVDAVQVSIQDVRPDVGERIAGHRSHAHKLEVAGWVKELGLPLTVNTVLHRHNIERVAEVVALAEALGADRLELANTQYLGWALPNRDALLPTRRQLDDARVVAAAARERLRGRMEILYVTPDYHADTPKACMDGWGRRFILVSPTGLALPCHAAHTLPGLVFDNVRDRSLAAIWESGPGFLAYRGEAWMPEPCRSCDRRGIDYGGCRCQAFHLTGDATATDPTCHLSPHHQLVQSARARADVSGTVELVYRGPAPPVAISARTAAEE